MFQFFKMTSKKFIFFIFMFLALAFPISASAASYYVSTSGSDGNAGSQSQPFKSFSKAVSALNPGDTLFIAGGTYGEKLLVNKSGSSSAKINIKPVSGQKVIIDLHNSGSNNVEVPASASNISIEGIEVMNSSGYCSSFSGKNIDAKRFIVHECQGHGTYVDGSSILIEGHTIYNTNLENKARSKSSGWGSALKLRVGANNVTIRGNTIYHNYGEGIAVTRGQNVVVTGNRVYDNYSVQIYVDNSKNVTVERNYATCSGSSGFEKLDGSRPSGIAIGEEEYEGWGAQLGNITIKNNIVGFCRNNIAKWASDVGGGLKTALIANNTLWGSIKAGIAVDHDGGDSNIVIANNIVSAPSGNGAFIENRAGINLHHNFWVNGPGENTSGTGDKQGNVMLAGSPSPSSPFADYKLQSASPARNSADTISSIPTDYEGKARYSGNSPQGDMGALEFEGGTPPKPSGTSAPSTNPTASPEGTPAPSQPENAGCISSRDTNQDGNYNLTDFFFVFQNLGKNISDSKGADVNCDGNVGVGDILSFIKLLFVR